MSKWKDAKRLVGGSGPIDLADAVSQALGFGKEAASLVPDAAGLAWDKAIKPVGSEFLDSSHPKEWVGDLTYQQALHAPWMIQDDDPEKIIEAHDDGGGRGVWEYRQGQNNRIFRGLADIAVDPTSWLTAGGASVGKGLVKRGGEAVVKGVAEGGIKGAVKQEAGRAVQGLGRVVQVTDLPNKAIDKAIAPALGRFAGTTVGKWISKDSATSAMRRSFDRGHEFFLQAMRENTSLGHLTGVGKTAANAQISPGFNPIQRSKSLPDIIDAFRRGRPLDPVNTGDRVFQRGDYAGKTFSQSSILADAQKMAADDHALARSAFGPKGGPVKGKGRVMGELQDKYGPNIDPLNPGHIQAMVEKNLVDLYNLDPTHVTLSDEANAWLHDTFIKSGDFKDMSYYDAIIKAKNDFLDAQQEVINDVKVPWPPQRHIMDMYGKVTGKKARQAFNKYAYHDIDVLNADPDSVGFFMLERAAYKDAGIETRAIEANRNILRKMSQVHSDFASMWKGIALLSPRYHLGNLSSNWINVALTQGLRNLARPKDIWNQTLKEFDKNPTLVHQLAASQTVKMLEDYGRMDLNRNVSSVGIPVEIGGAFNSAERFWGRLGLGRTVGRATDRAINFNRKISLGFDAASRSTLYTGHFTADMETRIPGITAEVLDQANKQGLALPPDISLLPYRDPAKLIGYYRGIGFTENRAIHLSRVMANAIAESDKVALKPIHKAMFSYYKTPLDELIGKIVPFHYYASRATALYAEEIMRSPFLAANISRGLMELADTDHAGLSARQKGWLNIMSGPAGYTLMANPDALFGVTKALGMVAGNGFAPEGETEVGQLMRWMKTGGYSLFPWFDGMFNMMGAYGDTFEPDMLGIRHRAIVGAVINEIVAENGGKPPEAFYAGANALAREHMSQWISAVAPGWLSQPVRRKNNRSGTIVEATMDKAIESRIIANNPGMTYDQLLAIMNDQESPEYMEAWQEVARAGVATQIMSFSLPTSVKFRDSSQDVRAATLDAVYTYARKHGGDYDPTGDAEFAADFKELTGKDWKPGMFEKAQIESDLASASPEGRKFVVSEYNYRTLGTSTAKSVRDKINAIKYDGFVPKGFFTPEPGKEDDLADQWLSTQSVKAQEEYAELLNLQSAFRVSHPEYGAYLDWRGQISYLVALVGEDGYSAYRSKIMAGNPNAAKFFRAKINEARDKFPGKPEKALEWLNQKTTSPDAFLAVTGQAIAEREARAISTNSYNAVPFDPAQSMVEQATPWNDAMNGQSQAQAKDPYTGFLQSFR